MGRYKIIVGAESVLILGLVVFVTGMVGIEYTAPRVAHLGPLSALAFAAVPAVLWLGYFYRQDRIEPEPKTLVGGAFILGVFVVAPLASFVVGLIPIASADLDPLSMQRLLRNILLIGMVQEMAKYVVVRYSIYRHGEFDEPMDGIVYMMACGTGFAVWVNYHRLSGQHHEVYLSIGAAQAVVTTLAHASFAGVLGYVMGRAKFSRRSAPVRGILLMIGLLVAAAFNGQFTLVAGWVVQRGLAQHPWYSVGYAAVSAAAIFGIIWLVSQRLLAASPFRGTAA